MDPEDPYSDPDHFQNSIISSFYLFRHILKISSKSVHKFLIYLVHKHIWQPGSRWSRSLPKSNHLFLVPFRTFPENFIKIHPWLFELIVFKNYISWIQKIQIVVQITRKIEPFFSFYHFFLLPFVTYPKNIIKIHPKTRLGQLGANISPDRSSLTPQVLIGNFLKHNYPLLYELQHINLLCLYLPRKMVYPQTPNT